MSLPAVKTSSLFLGALVVLSLAALAVDPAESASELLIACALGQTEPVTKALAEPAAKTCIPASKCCKVCSAGKACGDSCISRRYTCRKGRGCACDAAEVC